jgi:peptidoglycan hydrolase-like protein with peptidoglycan-binding domain
LIRVCCCYAGIIVGDFNTASQVSILSKTGKFDIIRDKKYTKVQDYLLEGDILVTETKGHTVAALSNGAKATTSSSKPTLASYTIKKGNKGSQVKTLQQDLNYVLGTKLDIDGDCGTATVNAILEFQKKFGIKQTGVYDKDTYNKMKAVL